ncbi:MAG TPA: apolipoprotein N-acyltransferase [Treponema sp.]|nr:apolipoprotein N-acyltransferase [Treponema sp.]
MKFFYKVFLVILASLFFACAHPGLIFEDGCAFFGFIALAPVFILVKKSSVRSAWFWGALYGMSSYGLLCYWLAAFNPFTIYIGMAAFALILALVFEAMSFIKFLFNKKSVYVMALLWCVYEYLKTKGFLGFSYGIMGYSLWKSTVLLQSSSFGGVWYESALCAGVSALIADCVLSFRVFLPRFSLVPVLKRFALPISVLTAAFSFSLVYGFIRLNVDEGAVKKINVVCVQNNTDSNKYGPDVYKRDVSNLVRLTDEALSAFPETDIVLWPETAVVPPIEYNFAEKKDEGRYQMVLSLMDYFSRNDVCFVLGNQRTLTTPENEGDYNAALVFDRRKTGFLPPEPEVYAKIHLVPFTEYFPFAGIFPRFYKLLLNGDSRLWSPGSEAKVFEFRNLTFSTPICFEDSFGNLCRTFVVNGAECLFSLSNDSWSQSRPCQKQHLSMSVFRCTENAVPAARSTASGVTCIIDGRGRIVSESPQFEENYVCGAILVPLNRKSTLYTLIGDWIPAVEMILLFLAVLIRVFQKISVKIRLKPVERGAGNKVL